MLGVPYEDHAFFQEQAKLRLSTEGDINTNIIASERLIAYFDRDRVYRYINRGYHDWFGLDTANPGAPCGRLNPDILEVAVVGIPDRRMGEVGVAFVVPRAGATVDPDALVAWCREHMANYKVPRRVEVVDAFPLNASGKVLKYQLREKAGQ